MTSDVSLPAPVLAALCRDGDLVELQEELILRGTGAATVGLAALTGIVGTPERELPFKIVRKTLAPLREGRHAALAGDARHWAYWRREVEAYRSGLLPTGPGLRSPRCYAVVGDQVFLEAVDGAEPSLQQAAAHLAGWQIEYDASFDRPWFAMDQLGRRLQVTELDWTSVKADSRIVHLWDRRHELYERLRQLPLVLSHGDYSIGNLVADGSDTIAIDWATVGWEPLGFDLAHLALSVGADPTGAYLAAASAVAPDVLRLGFGAATAIIGASRVHWMLSREVDVPKWYVDFLWDHQPLE